MRLLLKSKTQSRRSFNEIKEILGIAAKFDATALESISDAYEIIRTYLHIAKKNLIENYNEYAANEILSSNEELPNNIMKITNSLEKLVNINRKILNDDTAHKSLQTELNELKKELLNTTNDNNNNDNDNNSNNGNLIQLQKKLEEINEYRKKQNNK